MYKKQKNHRYTNPEKKRVKERQIRQEQKEEEKRKQRNKLEQYNILTTRKANQHDYREQFKKVMINESNKDQTVVYDPRIF